MKQNWLCTLLSSLLSISALSACGAVSNVAEEAGIINQDDGPLLIKKERLSVITAEVAYREVIIAEGGYRPFRYELKDGALFDGLELNAETGEITGTVSKADHGKTSAISITVTDSGDQMVMKAFELSVAPYTYSILPETLPVVIPDLEYSFQLLVPGASTPVRFTASGQLPPGLSLNETGLLYTDAAGVSGRYANSNYIIQITAQDNNSVQLTKEFTVRIGPATVVPPLEIRTTSITNPVAGQLYAASIAVTGGVSPYEFYIDQRLFPDGLTYDTTTGVISGTPAKSTAGERFSLTVNVTDAQGTTVTTTSPLSAVVAGYSITLLPESADAGIPLVVPQTDYSFSLTAMGAEEPVTFSVSGELPTNMIIEDGVLKIGNFASTGGVPASQANTTKSITVTAIDANARTVNKQYTIRIGDALVIPPLEMVTTTILDPTAGNLYTQAIAAAGGLPAYTYSVAPGYSLPSWMSLDTATGVLSGTPSHLETSKTYRFKIKVVDRASSASTSSEFFIQIQPYTLLVGPETLPNPSPDKYYQLYLVTSGGTGPYTYELIDGSLPTDLTLSSSGLISGTTSAAGSSSTFRIRVTDTYVTDLNRRVRAEQTFTLTVPSFTVSVSTSSLPNGVEGVAYERALSATGGTAPYTFSYTGNLPSGIGMSNSGYILGTPSTNTGNTTYTVQVRAIDANGAISAARSLSLYVLWSSPVIDLSEMTIPTEGVAYSYQVPVTGGHNDSNRAFSLLSGALPTGLSLSTVTDTGLKYGVISGTPTAAGSYTFEVKVYDGSIDQQATESKTISVLPGLYVNTYYFNNIYNSVINGSAYTFVMAAAGGDETYTFSAVGLPTGLSISTAGTVSGTVNASAGTYTVSIIVTDSRGVHAVRSFNVEVTSPLLVDSQAIAAVNLGAAFTPVVLSTTGGAAGAKTYAVVSGTLPPGLSLSSSGTISGTVASHYTNAGSYTFGVRATDAYGQTSPTQNLTVAVNPATALNTLTCSLTAAGAGQAYSGSVLATGGSGVYTYASSGTLPPGLTLATQSNQGVFQGVVETDAATQGANSYSFSVRATDSYGQLSNWATCALSIYIPPKLKNTALPPARISEAYYARVEIYGGVPPYSFNVADSTPSLGDLGLSINANGIISGTINGGATAQTNYFNITATDANGLVNTSKTVTLSVVENASSTLSLTGARFSEICDPVGGAMATTCGRIKPFKVDSLTRTLGGAASSDRFVVFTQGDFASSNSIIYISKIDSQGRISSTPDVKIKIADTEDLGFKVGDLEIADMDRDGKKDLVVTNYSGNAIVVFWNLTDDGVATPSFDEAQKNTFTTPTSAPPWPALGTSPYSLKVVSLGNDPDQLDVIATTDMDMIAGTGVSTISVFRSQCTTPSCTRGTLFSSSTWYPTCVAGTACNNTNQALQFASIAVGDFYSTGCKAIVAVGRRYASPYRPQMVILKQPAGCDKTFTVDSSANLSAFLGNLNGDYRPGGVAVGDFDGDSKDDIAVTFNNYNYIYVFSNGEPADDVNAFSLITPSFSLRLPIYGGVTAVYSHQVTPFSMCDSCTYKSLAVAMGRERYMYGTAAYGYVTGIAVFPNLSEARLTGGQMSTATRVDYSLPTGLRSPPVLMDVIGDSKQDLIMLGVTYDGYGGDSTSINREGVPYFLTLEGRFPSATAATAPATAPFKQQPMLKSYGNDAVGTDGAGTTLIIDVDGDGKREIVTHLPNSGLVSVQNRDTEGGVENSGAFGSGEAQAYLFFSSVIQGYQAFNLGNTMAAGDFNNDGRMDVVVSGYNSKALSVMLATGDSGENSFSGGIVYSAVNSSDESLEYLDVRPMEVQVGDLNRDSRLDIIFTANHVSLNRRILRYMLGNGDGTFSEPEDLYASADICAGPNGYPRGFRVRDIDLNDNGQPEIVLLCEVNGTVFLFRDSNSAADIISYVRNTNTIAIGTPYRAFFLEIGHLNRNKAGCSGECPDLVLGGFDLANPVRTLPAFRITSYSPFTIGVGSTPTNPSLNGQVSDIAIGDFDFDGRTDIAVGMRTQNNFAPTNPPGNNDSYTSTNGQIFHILLGNGDGSVSSSPKGWGLQNLSVTNIAAGYLNNDGCLDLVLGHRPASNLAAPYSRLPYFNISHFLNTSSNSSMTCLETYP